MTFGDFIDRLCYSDKMTIQIWLYDGGFANPIAMIHPDWEGAKNYSDRKISSIRFEEANAWVIELKIIFEECIFGQCFNPD